jgi:hypothetical protein
MARLKGGCLTPATSPILKYVPCFLTAAAVQVTMKRYENVAVILSVKCLTS